MTLPQSPIGDANTLSLYSNTTIPVDQRPGPTYVWEKDVWVDSGIDQTVITPPADLPSKDVILGGETYTFGPRYVETVLKKAVYDAVVLGEETLVLSINGSQILATLAEARRIIRDFAA